MLNLLKNSLWFTFEKLRFTTVFYPSSETLVKEETEAKHVVSLCEFCQRFTLWSALTLETLKS